VQRGSRPADHLSRLIVRLLQALDVDLAHLEHRYLLDFAGSLSPISRPKALGTGTTGC
jgi:hypothetical protein